MIRELLVANRGEIAIRAFRAANELGIRTIAIYPYEDRHSLHRQKADASYEIGKRGHPVRAYLDVADIVALATEVGADAIYPGYGFLSESPSLAESCARAGIIFVGPPASVLAVAGNKLAALDAAKRAGLPVLRSVAPDHDDDSFAQAAEAVGFPLFVKAASGGGGRGLRLVRDASLLKDAVAAARREGESAFGDETVFLEEAVIDPRHIEVQILADNVGSVVHLYERDCSVQRRHQKVVEIAPAPNLPRALRDEMCEGAMRFASSIGYVGAGTVEFLLDASGRYTFIEMNPRIQVEHTVTEEVTSVDLVRSQLRIAEGATLAEIGLAQERIECNGVALQCRITAEDPAHDFRPDTGVVTTYRAPGGTGIRLDEGITQGAEILPYFDSLLAKLTCRGRTFEEAVDRARRALAEFRIRGVATNISFLQAIFDDEDFRAGLATTGFISSKSNLLSRHRSADRATRLLEYLAEVTVNRPNGEPPQVGDPREKLPSVDLSTAPLAGSKQLLEEIGPLAFARRLRAQQSIAVTDTTFRDAHQSLLATRLRTFDILGVAEHMARLLPELFSIECWGGATYDVALRFLKEDPFDRLEEIRVAVPNICLQMLIRGRNTVGYSPYPDEVGRTFIAEAAKAGIDIFRIFDALNDVDQMRPAIDAVIDQGRVAEGALCYTGDLADPRETLYTLDYYLSIAERLVKAGVHVLCIKDMAGLLRAPAARILIGALRERFDQPVHLHTHDTTGGQLATYLAAIDIGVDAIDGAIGPMSGMTSQPNLAAIVATTDATERASGISLDALLDLEPYWDAVRHLYYPFESGLPAPTGRVYRHEIPGGQLSNLHQQAFALGLGDRFEVVEELYAKVNAILGNIVKVTPSSKVVGDLALHLAAQDANAEEFESDPSRFDIPDSVIGFLSGELGTPAGGWPEPFRTKALTGRTYVAPANELSDSQRERLLGPESRSALAELLFEGPARDYVASTERYGSLSNLPTTAFFYGCEMGKEIVVELSPGVVLFLRIDAMTDPDDRGYRTVYCQMNGRQRTVTVRDFAFEALKPTGEKAAVGDPYQIGAPFNGVISITVRQGENVQVGQAVGTIEAMKMEASVTSPVSGVVARVVVPVSGRVEAGDLLVVITP